MKLVASPLQSVLLFAAWLLLNRSLEPGHLVLGAALAIALPVVIDPLVGAFPRVRRPSRIAGLAAVVAYDVAMSNIEVARRILGPESALRVPIALTDPYAIATLAGIITMTPGTLTCAVAPDGRSLLVHALHLEDADALVAEINSRYEKPLMEIFA
jgi:multicomponent K+:H+ antiporter subunit E